MKKLFIFLIISLPLLVFSQGNTVVVGINQTGLSACMETGVSENSVDAPVVSPNPVNEVLHILVNEKYEVNGVNIYAENGVLVFSAAISCGTDNSIDVSGLAYGKYILRLHNNGIVKYTTVILRIKS